ncbi:ATP-binding protein [Nonomuraea sp. LPB2021202275-12-8]|uniref:ATP-binding protein n=1 Tax=Nonomuraea sp. LPB2021202275-12-8 TaxID=3120159 RepID=UPI00300C33B3
MTVSGAGEVSRREAEVLEALGARLTNAQIASRLHISIRTVESHVSSLLRKFGVADRRELAALAEKDTAPDGEVTGLPAARTTFVGRTAEREAILAAFESARLVTLVGPGGVGKTRLAVAAAEAAAPSYARGGAFVDLVPVRDGFVPGAVAAALGVSERPGRPLEDAIADRLGRDRVLLVLDNCEHLLDAVAAFVDRLLSRCPGTRALVTSRERLGVPGERVVPVEPLPLSSDAVALFRDRATAADPAFAVEAGDVEEICARLDGLPLAIELAAARSAALGPGGLLAALDDNLRLLAGGRGADQRHRSLRSVLGWSHDLLEEDERTLFRRLAVFTGGFDLDAVIAVTSGGRGEVADVLGRLAGKSLVAHQRDASRWRLLETVRAFAAERLDASGEQSDLRERHLEWAAATAEHLASRLGATRGSRLSLTGRSAEDGPDDGGRDAFDAVADDLRAALAGATAGPAPGPAPGAPAHRLARSLAALAYARRFLSEALAHYRQAAQLAPGAGEAARDLGAAAECALAFADAGQAFELQLAAAERAGAAGDGNGQAIALARASVVAKRHPGFGTGISVPGERLNALTEQAAAAGDPGDAYVAAHVAAAVAWNAKELATSDPVLAEHALDAARETGDPVLISAALDSVISAAARRGHPREAFRLAGERLTLLDAMDRDDPRSGIEIVDSLHTAGVYAIAVGDLPAALDIAGMAMRDDVTGSHPALARSRLVPPLVLTGAFDEALTRAAEMWDSQTRMDSPPGRWMVPALCSVALAHGLLGEEEAYRSWRARALAVGEVTERSRYMSLVAFVDARVAVHAGWSAGDVAGLVERAAAGFVPGLFDGYATAACAELAVAVGLPDAGRRLAAASRSGQENDWAAACLSRAEGRLRGDTAALEAALDGWERIGARFERACTLLLLPGRADEGRAELAGYLTERSG